MANKCKECGCTCKRCLQKDSELHLYAEIENLRQRLLERDNHIVTMETQFLNDANKFPNCELVSIREEILIWQDKYARLYEAHKRMQKVNQNLEDKLLRIVDKCETEKGAFTKDIATLSHRLAEANYAIHRLKQDNDKYRNDVNLAIQLLQCKPSNFVGQKYDTLPLEVQAKVRSYMAQKSCSSVDTITNDVKNITVPISSFPPTAMVYSVTKLPVEKCAVEADNSLQLEIVSAGIMARVLEDREKERIFGKHCGTCSCSKIVYKADTETQTENQFHESRLTNQNPILIGCVDANGLRANGDRGMVIKNDLKGRSTFGDVEQVANGNVNGCDKIMSLNNERDSNRKLNRKEGKEKIGKEDENWKENSWKKEERERATRVEGQTVGANDRNSKRNRHSKNETTQLTVIEVTSSDESPVQNQHTEATASPSFSSDSVVISTSDPSSLSSDSKSATNHDKPRSNKTSSRSCLVRVKAGSKNILLDSIGTYQTVLYTSGNERPNAILVHSKSRLERSDSTSSEDNFSDPPTREPAQLQRVAEWVESSNASKLDEKKEKSYCETQDVLPIFAGPDTETQEKDLISFEVSSEGDRDACDKDSDYKVKVTKEMEETYLKLTASLDPKALKLDESQKLGITIEKYRQDYERCLQKIKTHCS